MSVTNSVREASNIKLFNSKRKIIYLWSHWNMFMSLNILYVWFHISIKGSRFLMRLKTQFRTWFDLNCTRLFIVVVVKVFIITKRMIAVFQNKIIFAFKRKHIQFFDLWWAVNHSNCNYDHVWNSFVTTFSIINLEFVWIGFLRLSHSIWCCLMIS